LGIVKKAAFYIAKQPFKTFVVAVSIVALLLLGSIAKDLSKIKKDVHYLNGGY
jgi:hypothetical protein